MSAITSNLNINKHKNKNIMKNNNSKTTTSKMTTKKNAKKNTNKRTTKIITYSTNGAAANNIKWLFYKRKQHKATYNNTFNADLAPGYMSYNATTAGVQHGRTEAITGTANHSKQYEATFVSYRREEFKKYKGNPASNNEKLVGKFLSLYLASEKNITTLYHQPIGYRPGVGPGRPMEADYVIMDNITGWKMMLDINGGQCRDNPERNVFHGKKNEVDKYKKDNYKKLGFNAMYVVNVYDNGKNQNVAYHKAVDLFDASKSKVFRLLELQEFKNAMIDVLTILEKAKLIKFDYKKFARCINEAHDFMVEKLTQKKQNDMATICKVK